MALTLGSILQRVTRSLVRPTSFRSTYLHTSQIYHNQLDVSSKNANPIGVQTVKTTQSIDNAEPQQAKLDPNILLPEKDKLDFFSLKNLFTIEDLMEARVHLGHKEGMLDGHMRPYIFGKRLGVLIFDLEQTAYLLNKALLISAEIAYRNGIIMFVHSSRQTGHMVEETAKECGEYAHCRRWRDDVFTNSQSLFQAVTRLPDLVIFLSVLEKVNEMHKAVTMSAKMLIPTIGVCDTNANPTLITYPVPGNDDTPQAIELYCRLFKTAIMNGKRKRSEIIEKYGEDFYNKTLETS